MGEKQSRLASAAESFSRNERIESFKSLYNFRDKRFNQLKRRTVNSLKSLRIFSATNQIT